MADVLTTDRFSRQMTMSEARGLIRIEMLFWLASFVFAVVILLTNAHNIDKTLIGVVTAVSLAVATWSATLQLVADDVLARLVGINFLGQVIAAAVFTTVALFGLHNVVPEVGAYFILTTVFAFCIVRVRWAVLGVAVCCVGFAAVLIDDGSSYGWLRWSAVMLPCLLVGTLVGPLPARAAAATREAEDARDELATTNAGLEKRVADQVAELQRAAELRRFLSPEIADAVMSADHLLEPHRREIAVLFTDLRGFTAFASRAEPEDVLQVLNDYYACVAEVLRRHGATMGDYAGDGMMGYLGDPLPVSDPAGQMLRTAGEARDAVTVLTQRWRRSGHDLGVGMGVALGHATLGVVGSQDRRSYTPLGSVVNLAARLCSIAADGEVLMDQRAMDASGLDLAIHSRAQLKGFGEVPVFALS